MTSPSSPTSGILAGRRRLEQGFAFMFRVLSELPERGSGSRGFAENRAESGPQIRAEAKARHEREAARHRPPLSDAAWSSYCSGSGRSSAPPKIQISTGGPHVVAACRPVPLPHGPNQPTADTTEDDESPMDSTVKRDYSLARRVASLPESPFLRSRTLRSHTLPMHDPYYLVVRARTLHAHSAASWS